MNRIVLISPNFFGYNFMIKEKLVSRNDLVISYNDLPIGDGLYFSLSKILPRFISKLNDTHEKKILQSILKYDIQKIFIIKGTILTDFFFKELKRINSNIEIINYQWDSVINNPNALVIAKYANRNYSFDINDCMQYSQFKYLPLFYQWSASEILSCSSNLTCDIDVLFIGGFHSNRHKILDTIKKMNPEIIFKGFVYIPFFSYVKKCFSHKIKLATVTFFKLNRVKYFDLLVKSKGVLDISSTSQTGTTIRTIEALSLKRKVITTNRNVVKEKFYNPNNILVIDPNNLPDLKQFLQTNFEQYDDSSLLYSLDEWLDYMRL